MKQVKIFRKRRDETNYFKALAGIKLVNLDIQSQPKMTVNFFFIRQVKCMTANFSVPPLVSDDPKKFKQLTKKEENIGHC